VPPKAKLRYEIELIGHWESASSAKERIAACEKKKQEGNDLFKQGMVEQALFAYRKSREYIMDLWNCEVDETIKCRQLIVMIQLNIAACHLKLKNYDDAIEVCKRALDRDSTSIKAYYRLGQAYLEKGEFQQSLEFVNSGLEVS
jgi:tetratricopeptide (TPR) repeat protein